MKCCGIHVATGELVELSFGSSIDSVEPVLRRLDNPPLLAPGWIDLQVNGYAGVDYNSPGASHDDIGRSLRELYACGVTLYELLTRHLPFEGSNIYEIVAAILTDREPLPLSRYAAAVPAELERIVGKALRKNREERYQAVNDLLLDLQRLRRGLELEGTHSTRSPRESAADHARSVRSRRVRRRSGSSAR